MKTNAPKTIHSMFETLQGLPLLMGLSLEELVEIVERVKFSFEKFNEGDVIVNQNDRCDKIIYILNGEICAERHESNSFFSIQESIAKTPFLIEAENIWGRHQRYYRTYTFLNEGSICWIEKHHLSYLLSNYDIVKTNYLNMICNMLQSSRTYLHLKAPSSTADRIINFIKYYKCNFHGSTTIKIKMDYLSEYIADTRLNVSKVLNQWKQMGVIQLKRGQIYIPNDELFF